MVGTNRTPQKACALSQARSQTWPVRMLLSSRQVFSDVTFPQEYLRGHVCLSGPRRHHWWAHLVGALRFPPYEHCAGHPPKKNGGRSGPASVSGGPPEQGSRGGRSDAEQRPRV